MPVADIPELLPCPFCGGALVKSIAYAGKQQHPEDPTWWAGCTKCDAGIDAVGEQSAIAAWNTRPAPPAMDREAVAITQREIDALRYLLNWDGTGKRISSVMKTFTLNGDERSYTKDALESLWAKLSTLSADAIRQGEGSLRAHVQKMQEACANYLEPTTYVARHPDTSRIGDCPWVREFEMPDRHASPEGAAQTNKRRDAAFIRDMIYMLDGPEQRAAMPATPASHASDGGKA